MTITMERLGAPREFEDPAPLEISRLMHEGWRQQTAPAGQEKLPLDHAAEEKKEG